MKKKYLYAVMTATMLSLGSCSGFLDTKPDTLLTQDQTFGDPTLVKSVLANFYGRVTIGQRIDDWDQCWTKLFISTQIAMKMWIETNGVHMTIL